MFKFYFDQTVCFALRPTTTMCSCRESIFYPCLPPLLFFFIYVYHHFFFLGTHYSPTHKKIVMYSCQPTMHVYHHFNRNNTHTPFPLNLAGRVVKIMITSTKYRRHTFWADCNKSLLVAFRHANGFFQTPPFREDGEKEERCFFKVVHRGRKCVVNLNWTPEQMIRRLKLDKDGEIKDRHTFTLNNYHNTIFGYGG